MSYIRLISLVIGIMIGLNLNAQKPSKLDGLWSLVTSKIIYTHPDTLRKTIPYLKQIELLADKEQNDQSWALSQIYLSYCYLMNEESEGLGRHNRKLGKRIYKLELEDGILDIIVPAHHFLNGKYFYDKGLYEQAHLYYQKTIDDLIRLVGVDENGTIKYMSLDDVFIMNAQDLFNDVALTYYKFGDFDKALDFYDIAVRLADKDKKARKLNNKGLSYLELGRMSEGISCILEAERINPISDSEYDRQTLSLIYKNQSYYYHLRGMTDSATYFILKALDVETKDEFKVKIMQQQLRILGQNTESAVAEQVFGELSSLTQKQMGYYHPDMSRNFMLLGNWYMSRNEWELADTQFGNGIRILAGKEKGACDCAEIDGTTISDKRMALEIIHKKAYVLSQVNRGEEAMKCFVLLDEVISALRKKYIINDESKYFLAEITKGMYADAISNAIRMGDVERAYSFSNASRSMVLMQQVQNKYAVNSTAIPKDVLAVGEQYLVSLSELEKQMENARLKKIEKTTKELDDAILTQSRLYEKWMQQLEKDYPLYYNMKYHSMDLSVAEINSRLRKEEATIFEYFSLEDRMYVFILDGRDLEVHETRIDSSFHSDVNQVHAAISQYDMTKETYHAFIESSYRLYQQLLAPFIKEDGVRNIVIIPDEELYRIPFEVLLRKKPNSRTMADVNYGQLDYAVWHLDFSYNYSTNLLQFTHDETCPPSFLGLAPTFTNRDIEPLKDNHLEVQAISELYDGARTFLSEEATTLALKQHLGASNILHLSTHAIFDDANPLDSRIELADTSLYIYEILALDHQLDLAIMSACQTASGKRRKGEGVVGLTRAFIQSGCPSVIASLWDVPDKQAMRIQQEFHQLLVQDGLRKNQALSSAKRSYLERTFTHRTHPFFWAYFVQIGDTSPICKGTLPWKTILYGSLVLILGITIGSFFKKLKKD